MNIKICFENRVDILNYSNQLFIDAYAEGTFFFINGCVTVMKVS